MSSSKTPSICGCCATNRFTRATVWSNVNAAAPSFASGAISHTSLGARETSCASLAAASSSSGRPRPAIMTFGTPNRRARSKGDASANVNAVCGPGLAISGLPHTQRMSPTRADFLAPGGCAIARMAHVVQASRIVTSLPLLIGFLLRFHPDSRSSKTPTHGIAANFGLAVFHAPFVKSGHSTGALPFSMDCPDNGTMQLMVTES